MNVISSAGKSAEKEDKVPENDAETVEQAATCAYPGCDRPPAPPPATGGRSRYCDNPLHTPVTAFRARRASRSTELFAGEADGELDRPVSFATMRIRDHVDRLQRVLGEVRQVVERGVADLAIVGNVESVEAQLAAVQAE